VTRAPLRIGVVGVGALGSQHARVAASLDGARLAAVFDRHPERADEIAAKFPGVKAAESLEDLAAGVDAAIVAVPTSSHLEVAERLLDAGRHVLVEKPMAATVAEAERMLERADARSVRLQVGHVERFNPAAEALRNVGEARFVEVHRLSPFPNRSLDIDVILDLMIHDLDLLAAIDSTEPVQVDAVGVPVLTGKVDIANVRIRFASGLIANLTASRVSVEKMRKFRVFGSGLYASCDFVARQAQVARLVTTADGPQITLEQVGGPERGAHEPAQEPLRRQAQAFVDAIAAEREPEVSGRVGLRVLRMAHDILARMATS
jgi:predicted dehydrogenase